MNDTPDNHVMKDLAVARAEDKLQKSLAQAASDWIILKEIRLRKMFRTVPDIQKAYHNEADFVNAALCDADFQTGAVNDDICSQLDEMISNQVNARYKI